MSEYEDKRAECDALGVTVTICKGQDGAPVVFVDTSEENESTKGPAVRVRLNDEPIWNGTEHFEQTTEAQLLEELEYALEVFDETCDCGECGPCQRKDGFRAIIAKAKGN